MDSGDNSSLCASSGMLRNLLGNDGESSTIFMKDLVYVAVSYIASARQMFPKKAFVSSPFYGALVEILDPECDVTDVKAMVSALVSTAKAINAKYLRLLLISVHNKDEVDTSKAIESYSFGFRYDSIIEANASQKNNNSQLTIEAVIDSEATRREHVAGFVTELHNLDQSFVTELPFNSFLSLKMYLCKKVTPLEYTLPGFHSVSSNRVVRLPSEAKKVSVGDIRSDGCVLSIETVARPFVQKSNVHISRKRNFAKEGTKPLLSFVTGNAEESSPMPKDASLVPTQSANKKKKETGVKAEAKTPVPQVVCPCGDTDEDGLMICCFYCQTWQHGVCFRVLTSESAPEKHSCISCAMKERRELHDTELFEAISCNEYCVNTHILRVVCGFRRSLVLCYYQDNITKYILRDHLSLNLQNAVSISTRLKKSGILIKVGKHLLVDREKLKKCMVLYFGQVSTDILFAGDNVQRDK